MTEKPGHKDILVLVGMLDAATADVQSAEAAESEARKVSYAARARLNDIQKQMDAAMQALRSAAPHGSDWQRAAEDPIGDFLRESSS